MLSIKSSQYISLVTQSIKSFKDLILDNLENYHAGDSHLLLKTFGCLHARHCSKHFASILSS